jgi:hypothetical protein
MPSQVCGFRAGWLSLLYALIPMFANLTNQLVTPIQGPVQGMKAMIKKSETELAFVNSKSPLPTVEVDSQSIEDAGFSIYRTVMQVLTHLAEQDAPLRATLYMYGTVSVNFREPCWSEFLLVAGPEKVLRALGAGFERLPAVKSRFSDYVPSSAALRTFHVQDGLVWEQEDASTWYSHAQTLADLTTEADEAEEGDDDAEPIEGMNRKRPGMPKTWRLRMTRRKTRRSLSTTGRRLAIGPRARMQK